MNPYKREARGSGKEKEDTKTEAKFRKERCYSPGFVGGGRGLLRLEKASM